MITLVLGCLVGFVASTAVSYAVLSGHLVVKNHHRLGWRWPRHYTPTTLHKHAFSLGPLTIFAVKDYTRLG